MLFPSRTESAVCFKNCLCCLLQELLVLFASGTASAVCFKNWSRCLLQELRGVSLVSCAWQTKNKMGNMLYYWSRVPTNASRGSNGSEPVCFDPFCVLIGKKGKSLLWPGTSQWRIYYHRIYYHVLRQSALFKSNHYKKCIIYSYILK